MPLYIENEVQDETKVFVNNHLSECQDCKKEFELLTTDFSEFKKVVDTTDDNRRFKVLVKSMMKKYLFVPLAVILALVIAFVSVIVSNERIGISYEDIESNFSEFFPEDEEYTVISQTSEDEKIMIFQYYNQDITNAGYFVYIQKDGLYFGYFLWSSDAIIYEISYDFANNTFLQLNDDEIAYILGNEEKIAKISVDGDIIEVDSEKPILQIFPSNADIVLYDVDGKVVELQVNTYKSLLTDNSAIQTTVEQAPTQAQEKIYENAVYYFSDPEIKSANETVIIWKEFTTTTGEINITNNSDTTGFVVYLYDSSDTSEPIAELILDDNITFTNLSADVVYEIGITHSQDFNIDLVFTE